MGFRGFGFRQALTGSVHSNGVYRLGLTWLREESFGVGRLVLRAFNKACVALAFATEEACLNRRSAFAISFVQGPLVRFSVLYEAYGDSYDDLTGLLEIERNRYKGHPLD